VKESKSISSKEEKKKISSQFPALELLFLVFCFALAFAVCRKKRNFQ